MRHHPIEVPFVHGAQVLRRRKRNAVEARYLSSVTVALREVEDEDAPVYLRHPHADGSVKEYRHHQGRTYVPKRRDDGGTDPADLGWLRGQAVVHKDRTNAFGGARRVEGVRGLSRIEDDDTVREVASNDEPKWAGIIAEETGRLLLVGGTLWERAWEPVLRLDFVGRPCVTIASGISVRHDDYRMDQADMMLEVGYLGAAEGRRLSLAIPEFDLLRPDLLNAPTLQQALNAVQGSLLAAMGDLAERAAPDVASAYLTLKADAHALFEATLTGRGSHDVEVSAAILDRACDAHATSGAKGVPRLRRKVDQVVRRVALQVHGPDDVAGFRP